LIWEESNKKDDYYSDAEYDDDLTVFNLDQEFQSSAIDLLTTCLNQKLDFETMKTEFTALMSTKHDLEQIDRSAAIVQAIVSYYYQEAIKDGIELFSGILVDYIDNQKDQVDFLLWFQCYMAKNRILFQLTLKL
jgi:hypothetical protein